MRHTLDSLDKTIDRTIVQRGKDYFVHDAIQEFAEQGEGVYTALVEGSEVYEVRIDLEGDFIADHLCDCPYDMGEFCKLAPNCPAILLDSNRS